MQKNAPAHFSLVYFQLMPSPNCRSKTGSGFFDGMFDGVLSYRGKYQFSKHFLGWDRVPGLDGKDDGDEFKCAQAIDSLGEVDYWLRNVSQHPNAFWRPVANGKTYPDFVAQLKDGRLLVVEYKGTHLVAEAAEKRNIGALWQNASTGMGIYVMVEKQRDGLDVKAQLRAAMA